MPDFSGFFWSFVPENLVNIIAYRDIKLFSLIKFGNFELHIYFVTHEKYLFYFF